MKWNEVKELSKLGLPMMATQFFIMATGFLDTAMAGHYSSTDLAGVALGGNVMWPVFMLMSGFNMALTPMIAHFRGENRVHQMGGLVRQGLWLAVFSSAVIIIVITNADWLFALFNIDENASEVANRYLKAAVLITCRNFVTSIYTSDLVVMETAATLLIIVAIFQIVDCTQATMIGSLRGYKDTKVPMIYSFIGYWVLAIPIGVVLGFGYLGQPLGVYGFWAGLSLGLLMVALLAGHRLYQTSHNEQRILRFASV